MAKQITDQFLAIVCAAVTGLSATAMEPEEISETALEIAKRVDEDLKLYAHGKTRAPKDQRAKPVGIPDTYVVLPSLPENATAAQRADLVDVDDLDPEPDR